MPPTPADISEALDVVKVSYPSQAQQLQRHIISLDAEVSNLRADPEKAMQVLLYDGGRREEATSQTIADMVSDSRDQRASTARFLETLAEESRAQRESMAPLLVAMGQAEKMREESRVMEAATASRRLDADLAREALWSSRLSSFFKSKPVEYVALALAILLVAYLGAVAKGCGVDVDLPEIEQAVMEIG